MKIRKVLTAAAAACLLLSTMCLSAFAEETTYTVTVYAGKQGAFNASAETADNMQVTGDKLVISGLQYGDRVSLDVQTDGVITMKDDKYYVKGIRQSGYDTSETNVEGLQGFPVTQDVDYVVAYGMKGEQVSYTVYYEDENGKQLSPKQTFYGNVGDKPVVSYIYIEGYQPQAYNLTRTLVSEADVSALGNGANEFHFVYSTNPEGETVTRPGTNRVITQQGPGTTTVVRRPTTTTTTTTTPAGGAAGANAAGNAAGVNPAAGVAENPVANAADDAAANAPDTVADANGEVTAGPEDLIDLDEQETPLAAPTTDGTGIDEAAPAATSAKSGVRTGAVVCGSLAGVAVIALATVFVLKRKKII